MEEEAGGAKGTPEASVQDELGPTRADACDGTEGRLGAAKQQPAQERGHNSGEAGGWKRKHEGSEQHQEGEQQETTTGRQNTAAAEKLIYQR